MAPKSLQPAVRPAVMTVREVADLLNIHQTTLYATLDRGEIPTRTKSLESEVWL
jgi:hypothetical protein